MLRRWTFAQRVGAGLSACLLAGLMLFGTLLSTARTLVDGADSGTHQASDFLVEVERLRRAFAEKVASGRGYVLSRAPEDLAERDAAREHFLASLSRLESHPAGTSFLPALAALRAAELRVEASVQGLRADMKAHAPAARIEHRLESEVRPARQELERRLAALANAAEHALEARVLAHDEAARGWLLHALLAGLLGLAGVGALGLVLRRSLAPLHEEHVQSEQRLHLFMDGVSDYALCFLEPDGAVSGWSTGAERLTGWDSADIIGQGVEVLHPEEALVEGLPRAYRERAAREGRLQSEGWRVRRDGSSFWAETLLTALRDEGGRLRGFAEVTRDITERRRAERMQALLAEAGRVLQPLAGARELGAALTRLCVPEVAEACVLYATPEGAGVGAGDDVRPVAVTCADAATRDRLWEPLLRQPGADEAGPARVVRTGRAERFPEVDPERLPPALRDSAHGELWRALGVRSALTVPLAVGPRVVGALCLLSTRKHRRYGAADQANLEELAARAALALDNARLLAETQGALELIGVAAHDLGNPLASLQLRLRRLRMLAAKTPERPLLDGLTLAEGETQRLGRLVHNLLDLSRLSAGRLALDTQELDLADLAREVVDRHADQAAAAGCALTVRTPPGTTGQWDRHRLDRVLTNLVSNALKFGHGQPVEVHVESDAHHARLVVRDHGAGISPEDQQRLFGRFERAHPGGHAGFGLGLYIVRQLVEAHGGTILVRSRVGEGAEFTVQLPRTPPAEPCLPVEAAV